jgi:hypothetical protein
MDKAKLFIVIGCCALTAAVFVFFSPKSWFDFSDAGLVFKELTTESAPKKPSPESKLRKLLTLQQKSQEPAKSVKKPAYEPPPSDAGQIQVIPPTNFNEVMVKTAISFAHKIGTCDRRTCAKIIDPSSEQWRIYAKIITESKNACSRRQLNACVIHGDILAAERRFLDAKDVAKSGLESAQSMVSRCSKGKNLGSNLCRDAEEKHKYFVDRIKQLNKTIMQAH